MGWQWIRPTILSIDSWAVSFSQATENKWLSGSKKCLPPRSDGKFTTFRLLSHGGDRWDDHPIGVSNSPTIFRNFTSNCTPVLQYKV